VCFGIPYSLAALAIGIPFAMVSNAPWRHFSLYSFAFGRRGIWWRKKMQFEVGTEENGGVDLGVAERVVPTYPKACLPSAPLIRAYMPG